MKSAKLEEWRPADALASLVLICESLAITVWDNEPVSVEHVATMTEDEAHDHAIRWLSRDGDWFYPEFQFTPAGIDPRIALMTSRFKRSFVDQDREPPLGVWAAWWTTPSEHLELRAPIVAFLAGEEVVVQRLAVDWTTALIWGLLPVWRS